MVTVLVRGKVYLGREMCRVTRNGRAWDTDFEIDYLPHSRGQGAISWEALRGRSYKMKVYSYRVRNMVTWQDRTGRFAEDVELNAVERAPAESMSIAKYD
jgi:hypothetical protein